MKADLRAQIERTNLRYLIDHPEALTIYRDDVGLTERDFADPNARRAYAAIVKAAASGGAIPDEVYALLLDNV